MSINRTVINFYKQSMNKNISAISMKPQRRDDGKIITVIYTTCVIVIFIQIFLFFYICNGHRILKDSIRKTFLSNKISPGDDFVNIWKEENIIVS